MLSNFVTLGENKNDFIEVSGEESLRKSLRDKKNEGRIIHTKLKASDKVIARVADGIYRHPASALRELISNAWDADASQVTIITDAPRFSKIYIRDNGNGMSLENLSHMINSIGGSSKRQKEGVELGVSNFDDLDRSPNGRLLIGKIGIGIFSISQIARSFRIVTKAAKTDYRLVAELKLRTYSEDTKTLNDDNSDEDGEEFDFSGDVYITKHSSDDWDAHGTDIILENIKPKVLEILRSSARWNSSDDGKSNSDIAKDFSTPTNTQPIYHIGWSNQDIANGRESSRLLKTPNLPWESGDSPNIRMQKLVDAVEKKTIDRTKPELSQILDYYLEMIWSLSLSAPVDYVYKHPFDLTGLDDIDLYWLSNLPNGQAKKLDLEGNNTVREAVAEQVEDSPILSDGIASGNGKFDVFIDGIQLKRPISFKFFKSTNRGDSRASIFVGQFLPDLKNANPSILGGQFGLEGYLFFNGVVVPKEHNGVLVRIRGSSGALYDQTFFKYQVAEINRLRKISSEIFILKGLDAALNIDRESFNYSHTHVDLLTLWLHRAILQLTNKSKEVGNKRINQRNIEKAALTSDRITAWSENLWREKQDSDVPEVKITRNETEAQAERKNGFVALSRDGINTLTSLSKKSESAERESRTQALIRVLNAYGLLDDKSYIEQKMIVNSILEVCFSSFEE